MSEIICGDCFEEIQTLEPESVDSVVTDPPYALAFMGKDWDSFETKEYQKFCREWGEQVLKVLKPGAYLLAFSGTRTYHRMVCGLEDAGFTIKDQIDWLYGSGFPKSHDISKAIDKHSRAKRWNGWGTALKPSHEPIVLAQKPRERTYAENVLKYGVGGLNIDSSRIPHNEDISVGYNKPEMQEGWKREWMDDEKRWEEYKKEAVDNANKKGRWPANIVLNPKVTAMLDEQSGKLRSGQHSNSERNRKAEGMFFGGWARGGNWYGDSGGASRFFYCAKAHKSERNAGLKDLEEVKNDIATLKPINLMRYLVRLVTPPDGTVLDPFAGSGTTGCACEIEGFDYILIEKRKRFAEVIAPKRIDYWSKEENWSDLKEHTELSDPKKEKMTKLTEF